MAPSKEILTAVAALLLTLGWLSPWLAGCGSVALDDGAGPAHRHSASTEDERSSRERLLRQVREEGARLWGLHCGRCHNSRDGGTCSIPGQCELCMAHMRIRAYLTGEEQRLIAAYLELTRPN